MATKPGTVYIVHHVDTEGPLQEPLPETFARIEQTLGITIDAPRTEATLNEIREGKHISDDPAVIAKAQEILDPHLINLHSTWGEIDAMLAKITSPEFRGGLPDSKGGGWIYNWHVVDQVGYETNERGKDVGYLKIFERYEKIAQNNPQDKIHWHFHPISFFREAHISATSYENSYPELHQILSRRLIDKKWFPTVNRAGFHTERPDSNWFLEQWIPFDASNQSVEESGREVQKDALNGRFGDWRGAPTDWSMYHPDLYDWRKKGKLNRVIARVLNLKSRFRTITQDEVDKAFAKAAAGEDVYLGITNHDFRDMTAEVDEFRAMLKSVAAKYPEVPFTYSEATEAFRKVLGYSDEDVKKNALDFNCTVTDAVLTVEVTNGELFGPQPYLAIKTKDGRYFHDNFDFGPPDAATKTYFYTFDRYTIPLADIDTIGIASNDKYGNCVVKLLLK